MTQTSRKSPRIEDLVVAARNAAEGGNLPLAHAILGDVVARDAKNPDHLITRALIGMEIEEIDAAAIDLTRALRINPQSAPAAWHLARLLTRYRLDDPKGLDRFGLRAALGHDEIAHQPIVGAILDHLFLTEPSLHRALIGARGGIDTGDDKAALDAARSLVLKRTADGLKDDLLLTALAHGKVLQPEIERLLTAVRRVLALELPAERMEDRHLPPFMVALAEQGAATDYAWAEQEGETALIDRLTPDRSAIAAGDFEACRQLLVKCLYRPLSVALGVRADELSRALATGVRPKPLRDMLNRRLAEAETMTGIAAGLATLKPLRDQTSARVAGQYEKSPYPRWQSIMQTPPGMIRKALELYFPAERLAYMDRPFDVLCAGCGTGQHALQSASALGPNARVLAIDISRASLAFAKAKAAELGIANVEFMQADILDVAELDRRFDMIESIGVLHHMADPFAGWRKLLSALKPDGMMYVGLYSRISRREITALRDDPAWPGPGSSDAAARAYRQTILQRFFAGATGAQGTILVHSRDFYALNTFRDLALHENEHTHTLGEIAAFMAAEGLEFRGFTLEQPTFPAFQEFVGAAAGAWPGKLVDWARFEAENPRTFDAMYRFWCQRRSS
ncbi:MAG: class I SAM-dependent methyltransferase [Hyphomicrobiaceae bacterium]